MSLCLSIPCKDEAAELRELVKSARPFVDEVVVLVDPSSEDDSVKAAHEVADRVYELLFPGSFGELCTLCVHLAFPHEWCIRLDCDERISGWGAVGDIFRRPHAPVVRDYAWAVRRRRWGDREQTKLVEPGPDWQVRLVPVKREARFVRRLHPDFAGLPVGSYNDAWIEHFHDLKSPALLARRQLLYTELAAQERIAVEGGQSLAALCACGHNRLAHAGALEYAKPPFKCYRDGCNCAGFQEAP